MSEESYHYQRTEYSYSYSNNNGEVSEYSSTSYGGYGDPDPEGFQHHHGGMVFQHQQQDNDVDENQLIDQPENGQLFLKVSSKVQGPNANVKLSNCEGRKRALLIGINYFNTENQLDGCINDVHNVKDFLMTLYGFKEEDMVILTDDQQEPRFIPTRSNIIAAMQWLVRDAEENDSFFFHYSGHGGFVEDHDDEADGYDETIYPVDHAEYEGSDGQIKDDDIHDLLVRPLPEGCRLTCIFDSCHSGTVLDLPYTYSTKGTLKEQNLYKTAGQGLLEIGMAYAGGDREAALSSLMSLGQKLFRSRDTEEENRRENSSKADVIMFSGCKDDQTSADAQEAGKATGAMSYAFTTTLRENPHQTYQELLNSVRDILRDRYSQRPQLSCSHPINVDDLFVC